MVLVLALLFLFQTQTASQPRTADVTPFWARAIPWRTFLDGVTVNREQWQRNWSRADAPPELAERLRRSADGLSLLIVAEDWCPDSVNTVPYIVKLASAAGVEVRMLNRAAGAALMDHHPAFDGRRVTPVVVVIRSGQDVGAWVERPAVVQDLFRSMAGDSDKAKRFGERQAWYDKDAGRTTDLEIVDVVERGGVRD
jgi:hypothetical protein